MLHQEPEETQSCHDDHIIVALFAVVTGQQQFRVILVNWGLKQSRTIMLKENFFTASLNTWTKHQGSKASPVLHSVWGRWSRHGRRHGTDQRSDPLLVSKPGSDHLWRAGPPPQARGKSWWAAAKLRPPCRPRRPPAAEPCLHPDVQKNASVICH